LVLLTVVTVPAGADPVPGRLVITDPVWYEEPLDHQTFDKTDLTALIVTNTPDELILEIPFESDWPRLHIHVVLETNFNAAGATRDPFEMPVNYGHDLKPDYVLTTKYSANDYGDFRRWNGSGWDFWNPDTGSYGDNGNIQSAWIEKTSDRVWVRIPSEPFGGTLPDSLMVAVYLTQEDEVGNKRSAFDSVPSDSTLNLTFDYENPGPGDWDIALGPVTLEAWSPVYHRIVDFPVVPEIRAVAVDPKIIEGGQTFNLIAEVFDPGDGVGNVTVDLSQLGGGTAEILRDDGDQRSGDRIAGDGVFGLLWEVPEKWMSGSYPLEVRAYDSLLIRHTSATCLLAVPSGPPIVQAVDPVGDDHGPNHPGTYRLFYTYPTNIVFVEGAFDLTGLMVYETVADVGGELVDMIAFQVGVRDFPNPADPGMADWNPLYADLNITKIDILIDSAPGGATATLPWRQAGFQPWDAWDWAIIMDGWYKALIPSMGSNLVDIWRDNARRNDRDILLASDPFSDTVTAFVSKELLGDPSPEDIRNWDICVAMCSRDFGGEEVLGGIRQVNFQRSEWNFGGGEIGDKDSNYLDLLLIPGEGKQAGRPQEVVMDHTTEEANDRFGNGMTAVALEMTAQAPSSVPAPAGKGVELFQNTPNPFNPRTVIAFSVQVRIRVSLRVYDVSGRLVTSLLEDHMVESGRSEITWSGEDDGGRPVSSGTYFYRLEAEGVSRTNRMVLLK